MAQYKKTRNNTIQSLTTLALALPGLGGSLCADDVPYDKVEADLKYTSYDESSNRYHIDVTQASFKIPVNDRFDLSATLQRDLMSGASAVLYAPTRLFGGGAVLDTLSEAKSGASIRDKRDAINLKGRYFSGNVNAGLSVGYSGENDYQSLTFGGDSQFSFNKKNTALLLGISHSEDRIKPSNSGRVGLDPDDPQLRGAKHTTRLSLGVKQDLSTTTYMQINAETFFDRGYLSDSYKRVLFHGDVTADRPGSQYIPYAAVGLPNPLGFSFDYDRRPRSRNSFALVGQVVHAIQSLKASLHFNYRYGQNDWGIRSHTLEASYYQPLSDDWDVSVLGRYYTQGEAKFYAMAFAVAPNAPFPTKSIDPQGYASADYRLGSYGIFGGEVKASKQFTSQIKGSLLLGGALRNANYALSGKSTPYNPSNKFNTYYASLQASFRF